MEPNQPTLEEWVEAYIEAQPEWQRLGGDHPKFWAVERFMIPETRERAEECWIAILEVLRRQPGKDVLRALAAGPLEDLIEDYGTAFIERIEQQAVADPAFKELLGGVFESGTPEVWRRVEEAAAADGVVA